MKHTTLARRYARALIELADSGSKAEALVGELDTFATAVAASEDFRQVLANPAFRAERETVIAAVTKQLGCGDLAKKALAHLQARDRLLVLEDIVAAMRDLLEARTGKVRATVTAAAPLSADRQQRIRAALERITGRLIVLKQEVDPELIGGVVARVGSVVYDGSLRTQLSHFRSFKGKEN